MPSKVTSEDIAPHNLKPIISEDKPSQDSEFTFEVEGASDEDIERICGPFNKMVIKLTGKDIFQLISENRL